jgi:hypothetical protein
MVLLVFFPFSNHQPIAVNNFCKMRPYPNGAMPICQCFILPFFYLASVLFCQCFIWPGSNRFQIDKESPARAELKGLEYRAGCAKQARL